MAVRYARLLLETRAVCTANILRRSESWNELMIVNGFDKATRAISNYWKNKNLKKRAEKQGLKA